MPAVKAPKSSHIQLWVTEFPCMVTQDKIIFLLIL